MHRILSATLFAALLVLPAAAAEPGEQSLWPCRFEVGPCARNKERPDELVWAPRGAKRIRALLLVIANTDSKHFAEHGAVRKVGARQEMGIVYLRCGEVIDDLSRNSPGTSASILQQILDGAARQTGIVEFRHAPWISFGKSSMGRFPFWTAWSSPERTIAGISYHGETPTWPPADWARLEDQTILYVSVNGETEWGGTWFRHVRPSLLNYRAQRNWLAHQVVVYDVGHGNYPDTHGSPGWGKSFPGRVTCIDVWDYLALFVEKAIEARVPRKGYPTRGPLELSELDESSGWLIDPFAVERLFGTPPERLEASPDGFLVDPKGDQPVPGYLVVAPPESYKPAQGVPVVPLETGVSPREWLITEGANFAMQNDPMRSLGEMGSLRPKPGDAVKIDDYTATFGPIDPRYVRREGGINLRGGLQPGAKCTLLAYTVLDVPRSLQLKLDAPFTANGRVQVVLAGEPVAHGQVVEVAKGLYPMLVVVRLKTRWTTLTTCFQTATPAEVAEARKAAAEQHERQQAGEIASESEEGEPTIPLAQPAADVSRSERKGRFWVIDRELAEAWLRLHSVQGKPGD